MKKPSECTTIEDVRESIDNIDKQIVDLLSKRAVYVHEVTKYKVPTVESVVAAKRRDEVLRKRREWAIERDLDPDVIESMYKTLIEYFIEREMKILNVKK